MVNNYILYSAICFPFFSPELFGYSNIEREHRTLRRVVTE